MGEKCVLFNLSIWILLRLFSKIISQYFQEDCASYLVNGILALY